MNSLYAVIVDDEPIVLSTLQHILEHRNYRVLACTNPIHSPMYQSDGCPCPLQTKCPDIIISDFNMPVMNGVDFLESIIQKGCHCRHLALISGYGIMDNDLMRMKKSGVRYFAKPIDLDDFYGWLDRVEQDVLVSHAA